MVEGEALRPRRVLVDAVQALLPSVFLLVLCEGGIDLLKVNPLLVPPSLPDRSFGGLLRLVVFMPGGFLLLLAEFVEAHEIANILRNLVSLSCLGRILPEVYPVKFLTHDIFHAERRHEEER